MTLFAGKDVVPAKAGIQKVKLPAYRAGLAGHASGEPNVSKGNFVHIVPLDPAYPALAGRGRFRSKAGFRVKPGMTNYTGLMLLFISLTQYCIIPVFYYSIEDFYV